MNSGSDRVRCPCASAAVQLQLLTSEPLCWAAGVDTGIPTDDVVTATSGYTGFIRTSGQRFVDQECQEYLPVGLNAWELPEMEIGLLGVRSQPVLC